MNRHLLPLGIFALLLVLLAVGLTLDPREVPSPLIGKAAPAFELPTLADPGMTLSNADFNDKVTLLNVWASWCSGCRKEHPVVRQLEGQPGVSLYGLNYKDTRENASKWLRVFGNPYQANAFDLQGLVGIDYGVYGVPETFVIDRRGVIRYKQIGPLTEETLQDVILPLVEKLNNEPV